MSNASTPVLEQFGNYFLLDRLASGGMAEIFRARPANADSNGRVVVIKRILSESAKNPEFLGMFRSEIQVCMGFNHPNTVNVHDFGETGGQPYIAMEYIEGPNLRQLINRFGQLNERIPVEAAVAIAIQAARGLHYAHTLENQATGQSLNVIHRDISPQNILLTLDGTVKIIDFGIAKAKVESSEATRTGIIKGKPSYLSPEQIAGENVTPRADVFALGCVFWEMLTGKKLYPTTTGKEYATLEAILYTPPPAPSTLNPAVPPELDAIVLKMLEKNAAKRQATADAVEKDLQTFLTVFKPGFGASELSTLCRDKFRSEILENRNALHELNEKAQTALSGKLTRKEVSLPLGTVIRTRYFYWLTPGRTKGALVYLLTVLVLLLDRTYSFFDRFLIPTDTVREIHAQETLARLPRKQAQAELPPGGIPDPAVAGELSAPGQVAAQVPAQTPASQDQTQVGSGAPNQVSRPQVRSAPVARVKPRAVAPKPGSRMQKPKLNQGKQRGA